MISFSSCNIRKGLLALLIGSMVVTSSCHHKPEDIEPKIDYAIQDKYLLSLPTPFTALTAEERLERWSEEYRIGIGFAHELDLYQAITAFKRSYFLVPQEKQERKKEIKYEILLCYYLGRKYQDVIQTFESTELRYTDSTFPAFHDLLVILYDSYMKEGEDDKAQKYLSCLHNLYPETAEKLYVSSELSSGDIEQVQLISEHPAYAYVQDFLASYEREKKSVQTAKSLNAVLPGAGYLYLGQKQSALTAFLLNALFIGATYYFFAKGNIPAGVIFTSFESGWYFGGIYGAGEEAKFYNEHIYEKYATPMMNENKLFPGFMIDYAF